MPSSWKIKSQKVIPGISFSSKLGFVDISTNIYLHYIHCTFQYTVLTVLSLLLLKYAMRFSEYNTSPNFNSPFMS